MIEKPIRLVIADDHPIFKRGLVAVLSAEADMEIVGQAANGEEALAQVVKHCPDVAVLDLDMPKLDGFGVAAKVHASGPPVAVVFLTLHRSESLLNKAFDLGVQGYVLKDSAIAEIVDCIRAVYGQQRYISPPLATFLINRRQQADSLEKEKPGLATLTATERRVLKLVASENSSRDIADSLSISIRTVDRHRANICTKLDLHGVNSLIKFAIAHRNEL